jgi:hypothetical protein
MAPQVGGLRTQNSKSQLVFEHEKLPFMLLYCYYSSKIICKNLRWCSYNILNHLK